VELVPFILKIPGVTSFLSEHLSQDPLEKYFGMQRQKGSTNANPYVAQFLKNNQTLCVVKLRGMCPEVIAVVEGGNMSLLKMRILHYLKGEESINSILQTE